MMDDVRDRLSAAWDEAATATDTWRCPECGYEVELSGAVHIEWGNPECHDCHHDRGRKVLLRLGQITPKPTEE